ncbi:hypothetical protein BPT24_099 [Tenacibaculum phage pT24]|uniref:Uncharacterized protein n=1 Tax=Tenacibaculum phage pT24 TaxID=1880590 RepID=A0A1W7GKQ0_9CAUD|nr:hypothetical protein HYP10_gp099 [Tenacibaculum phage pT24]BAX25553.1 hypothetical protein BPT24_099 [Tenacibaculum phage pT24]
MIKEGDIHRECVKNEELLKEIDNELNSVK